MTEQDDRRTIAKMHERYLELNSQINYEQLPEIWSADPSSWFFNLTGHNYHGLEHWLKLWRYYHDRIETISPWVSDDPAIRVHGDVAWVTCTRTATIGWKGEGEPPFEPGTFKSRSTQIYFREPEGWKVVHAHFSYNSGEPRPGGI